jgi:tetratricopeptide (TPR) repeat protein
MLARTTVDFREIKGLNRAVNKIIAAGSEINVFLGSAVSFGIFPDFKTLAHDISGAIFSRGYPLTTTVTGEHRQRIAKLRPEVIFEEMSKELGRKATNPLVELESVIPKEASIGHDYLAQLMHLGFVHSVLTTNWDPYLKIAWNRWCSFQGQNASPRVSHFEEVRLHGTLNDPGSILFTISDTYRADRNREFAKMIDHLQVRPTLFLGYSGQDEDVRNALRKAGPGCTVFWLCFNNRDFRNLRRWIRTYDNLPSTSAITAQNGDLNLLLQKLCAAHKLKSSYSEGVTTRWQREDFKSQLREWASHISYGKAVLVSARLLLAANITPGVPIRMLNRLASKRDSDGMWQEASVLLGRIHWSYASSRAKKGSYEKAVKILAPVAQKHERGVLSRKKRIYLEACDEMATALAKLERRREGLKVCEQGLRLNSNDVRLLTTKGMILLELNDFERAEKVLEKAYGLADEGGNYFEELLSALNLHCLSLRERISSASFDQRRAREYLVQLAEKDMELERLSGLYQSPYFESCALINRAHDQHRIGDLKSALETACRSFRMDFATDPQDPDFAVTCEVLSGILIDCAPLCARVREHRRILKAAEFVVKLGINVVRDDGEAVLLDAQRCMIKAQAGDFRPRKNTLERCILRLKRLRNSTNLFWLYIYEARLALLRSIPEAARRPLQWAARLSRSSFFLEFYRLHQALALDSTTSSKRCQSANIKRVRAFAEKIGHTGETARGHLTFKNGLDVEHRLNVLLEVCKMSVRKRQACCGQREALLRLYGREHRWYARIADNILKLRNR